MTRVVNLTNEGIDLLLIGEAIRGVPPTAHIAPGETSEDIPFDEAAASFRGLIIAGAAAIVTEPAPPVSPAPADAPQPTE